VRGCTLALQPPPKRFVPAETALHNTFCSGNGLRALASTLVSDIDSLDPVYAPGTGTPECGGLTTREALQLLRGLRGLNLVGADMVEVSPPFDTSCHSTALAGATVMYEQLCLLADPLRARE
jgi:guanidinopropionase